MLKAHIFAKEMTFATKKKKKKYWLDYYQVKIIFPYKYVSLT